VTELVRVYLLYVDESGDCGMVGSPTRYYVLAGVVVHEADWLPCLDALVTFRRLLRQRYGLKLREELHASHLISRPGPLARIKRDQRLAIIRQFADCVAHMPVEILVVVADKNGKHASYDAFDRAWTALVQRLENTLTHGHFRASPSPDERGAVFPDRTDDKKLTRLVRRMRRYNPVPHCAVVYGPGYTQMPIERVVEDPSFRDSAASYFIQAADVTAYLVHQSLVPNGYFRRKGARNYYKRLAPVYCPWASSAHPLGFVML
jgi:hypothetical protein